MATTATKTKKTKKKLGRPPMGYACPLLSYGSVHRAHNDWRVVLSREPGRVRVTEEHIKKGIPGNAQNCVFALAFADHFGPQYDVQIGPTVTSVISEKDKVELKFHTPIAIARQLKRYDTTHVWSLPSGLYRFGPMSNTVRRRATDGFIGKKKKKGGSSTVTNNQRGTGVRRKARPAAPTRLIIRNNRIKRSRKS